ncbi:DNA primase small subunit, partial [Mytilus galloprovincialis]
MWDRKDVFNRFESSNKRWQALCKKSEETLESQKYLKEEVMLQYVYPRLDVNVSKGVNHLLKSPFCVHPKTGRCGHVILIKINDFTVQMIIGIMIAIIEELNTTESKDEDGKKIKDYKKTSLAGSMVVFEKFLTSLENSWKGKKLEESGQMIRQLFKSILWIHFYSLDTNFLTVNMFKCVKKMFSTTKKMEDLDASYFWLMLNVHCVHVCLACLLESQCQKNMNFFILAQNWGMARNCYWYDLTLTLFSWFIGRNYFLYYGFQDTGSPGHVSSQSGSSINHNKKAQRLGLRTSRAKKKKMTAKTPITKKLNCQMNRSKPLLAITCMQSVLVNKGNTTDFRVENRQSQPIKKCRAYLPPRM